MSKEIYRERITQRVMHDIEMLQETGYCTGVENYSVYFDGRKPGDAHPEELDIAICVDRVQAALDIEVRRVVHSWAGLRTFAPDRVPVVGFDPQVAGLFWCAGQGGYGIQTSPALARTAAALAKQEKLPADVAAEGLDAEDLSPIRFAAAAAVNRHGCR